MLTDTQCGNAKAKARPYKLTDGKGLYLEVKPNGVKAWRYRFESVREDRRKESVFAIGEYTKAPAGESKEEGTARRGGRSFTLGEAREERARARALVIQGINPAHDRKETERICIDPNLSCMLNKRSIIRERINAGLVRARVNGKRLGRPRVDHDLEEAIRQALTRGDKGIRRIARELGLGVSVVQRVRNDLLSVAR